MFDDNPMPIGILPSNPVMLSQTERSFTRASSEFKDLPFPAALFPQKKPLHFGLPTMPIRMSQQPDASTSAPVGSNVVISSAANPPKVSSTSAARNGYLPGARTFNTSSGPWQAPLGLQPPLTTGHQSCHEPIERSSAEQLLAAKR